eukprot:CAMPEP_0179075902 /NCGR_PEP_ID=MMETSP0796-20121207/33827_1 /TAXON_ID=73915 /ORGANISM="Pyrodinium bahamense, Strain pbaha01" /LENGTH=162 /DNA_ID=CAMNT_0020773143 /DNA_START=64 /DNA_END=552 /DNA_ORIENTATION=-
MKLNDKTSIFEASACAPPGTGLSPTASKAPIQTVVRRTWADVVRAEKAPTKQAPYNGDDEETRTNSTLAESEGESDAETHDSSPLTAQVQTLNPEAAVFMPALAASESGEAQQSTPLRSAAPLFVPRAAAVKAAIGAPPGLQTPLRAGAAAFVPRALEHPRW